MKDVVFSIGSESEIQHLAQEAVEIARRLGFGKPPQQQILKELAANRARAQDLLNGGALFIWGDEVG
jgi:hypothetical protein